MDFLQFFKSVLDEDKSPIVIANLENVIIYMNPSACDSYKKYGGAELLGCNLMDCHDNKSKMLIQVVKDWFEQSESHNRIYMYYSEKENKDVYMIALRDENKKLIGYYEKHESREREKNIPYKFS